MEGTIDVGHHPLPIHFVVSVAIIVHYAVAVAASFCSQVFDGIIELDVSTHFCQYGFDLIDGQEREGKEAMKEE